MTKTSDENTRNTHNGSMYEKVQQNWGLQKDGRPSVLGGFASLNRKIVFYSFSLLSENLFSEHCTTAAAAKINNDNHIDYRDNISTKWTQTTTSVVENIPESATTKCTSAKNIKHTMIPVGAEAHSQQTLSERRKNYFLSLEHSYLFLAPRFQVNRGCSILPKNLH